MEREKIVTTRRSENTAVWGIPSRMILISSDKMIFAPVLEVLKDNNKSEGLSS